MNTEQNDRGDKNMTVKEEIEVTVKGDVIARHDTLSDVIDEFKEQYPDHMITIQVRPGEPIMGRDQLKHTLEAGLSSVVALQQPDNDTPGKRWGCASVVAAREVGIVCVSDQGQEREYERDDQV